MVQTASKMRLLGSRMPAFELDDVVSGERFDSKTLAGKVTVVAFICNHCPFVIHIRRALREFAQDCRELGVAFVAISSNDVAGYPMDGPVEMRRLALAEDFSFPYLYDESQDVALTFDAACTPDFFVFDAHGALAYRGQFDGSRPGNSVAVSGTDLRAAVLALLSGTAPDSNQRPSIGCNIKWKPENAPA